MVSRLLASIVCLLLTFTVFTAKGEEESEGVFKQKPIYVSMLPHFLVNLGGQSSGRFMQLKANTHVANKDTENALMLHMPAVRHNILMKLSHLEANDVRTSDQKESLRQEVTEIISKTLGELSEFNNVKGFYITSIVIQ